MSMKNSMRFIALSMFVLCIAFSAFAQTSTTGSISGTVLDVNGAAVPNVTITVRSPNLIIPQEGQSNDQGRYNIANLPPGRYEVSVAAASGFGEFTKKDVEVNLSKTTSVEVQLQAAGAQATVTVTDTSGATVDVTSTTSGSNVSTDQFSNFPTSRTVQGLYTIAPTVVRSGLRDASGRERDPSVGGSSGPENNYILDGVNTTDPAFGGSGANIPFEFVQEVEVKTGAYGAEYGKSTGGIFNVITKSGTNEFHGDLYGYFTTKGLVRETKSFPFTGSAPNGFSEQDIGGDIGGPIIKDKLWFFGAFNPQRRTNNYLTQTLRADAENKVSTPFYAGKLTWGINQNHTFSFSTFGDFTKIDGFLATGALTNVSGFGESVDAFNGIQETGGHNYAFRLNSTFSPKFIGEFSGGLHFQRANTIPVQAGLDSPLRVDNFAVVRGGVVLPVTQTGVFSTRDQTGFADFIDGRGGELARNFFRGPGFGLFSTQDRNRYEFAAKMQKIWGRHTIKFGGEWNRNIYNINTASSGPDVTFAQGPGVTFGDGVGAEALQTNGYRTTNNFSVCTTRGAQIVCPSSAATAVMTAPGLVLPTGLTSAVTGAITESEALNNPFLVRLSTRVRDFQLFADTYTDVQSFYVQDDYKILDNLQLNFGVRFDYQQAYGNGATYLKLNDTLSNLQPRLGLIWDFTRQGKGKIALNYSRTLETPIPLDLNVRAGSEESQTDKNFNVRTYNAPAGSLVASGFDVLNLGAHPTPIDPNLKPQTVNEFSAAFEYEIARDLAIGVRGIYRAQDEVIEDGSFDDGNNYFIFNPGRNAPGTTERLACAGSTDPDLPFPAQCFGPARRYYRAVEFTATKRFTNNYQFIASYVYSSLIGNYEGLFRNDNGQSDPNITSLFDLVSLLNGLYGRLPNDRPHVFKFNGSYRTPFKLVLSGNYYSQSGIPFNQLVPHPIYGNNEGFAVPRGTAVVPNTGATVPGGSVGMEGAIGSTRLPFTHNLDFGAYYPIQFSESKQLRFQLDWFNVLNSQRGLTGDQTFSINSGIGGVAPIQNPFYGSGLIFQFPSSLRLGVKFQF